MINIRERKQQSLRTNNGCVFTLAMVNLLVRCQQKRWTARFLSLGISIRRLIIAEYFDDEIAARIEALSPSKNTDDIQMTFSMRYVNIRSILALQVMQVLLFQPSVDDFMCA